MKLTYNFKTAAVLLLISIIGLNCAGYQTVPPEKQILKGTYSIRMSRDELFSHLINRIAGLSDKGASLLTHDRKKGIITATMMTEFKNVLAPVPCRYHLAIEIKQNKYSLIFSRFIGLFGDYQDKPDEISLKMHYDQVRKSIVKESKAIKDYLQSKLNAPVSLEYLRITRVVKNYVLIDGVGNWQINDEITVYRKLGLNYKKVGSIKIITSKNNKLAGQLSTSSVGKVRSGDEIKKYK